MQAIESGVDKIRINPGNIGSEEKIKAVVDGCKKNGIPIRIGVNSGSLEKDLQEKYGVTAKAIVESAKRHIQILENLDFYDIAVSLKASDLDMCVEAYEMAADSFDYPLHLGITEAGTSFGGTIKSSIGLGIMLKEGIGNTIRVSLSDNPVQEIKVAKEILKNCGLYNDSITFISCPTCGRTCVDLLPVAKEFEDFCSTLHSNIKVAVMGCSVNGIGEGKEADIGIAGGNNEWILFKKGEAVRNIPHKEIKEEFKKEILDLVDKK